MSNIKSVNVRMSRIGIHTKGFDKTVYVPSVDITYTKGNRKKLRTIAPVSEGNRDLKRKDFQGLVVCGDFFVILFTNEWEILSDDCKLLATMKPCGIPIQANEDDFIVREGNSIACYDKNGNNTGSRELTAEEIEYLDKK